MAFTVGSNGSIIEVMNPHAKNSVVTATNAARRLLVEREESPFTDYPLKLSSMPRVSAEAGVQMEGRRHRLPVHHPTAVHAPPAQLPASSLSRAAGTHSAVARAPRRARRAAAHRS